MSNETRVVTAVTENGITLPEFRFHDQIGRQHCLRVVDDGAHVLYYEGAEVGRSSAFLTLEAILWAVTQMLRRRPERHAAALLAQLVGDLDAPEGTPEAVDSDHERSTALVAVPQATLAAIAAAGPELLGPARAGTLTWHLARRRSDIINAVLADPALAAGASGAANEIINEVLRVVGECAQRAGL